ncbi:alpha/beta hydrolase family protein [Pseudonocardia spinosispora]|uniref:alpha/beta hydrolase family protein n=1 Tax=Pseudonocardia spinosispora TaxID=103441 RepID=UPI0003FEBF0D|nr:alpha/beta fold hydrolase [Pseudonocardia spinosispora]
MQQLLFPDDAQFWFETLRVFGHSSYGGSDFGEVVATASRITSGDYDSWHDAWLATAERVAAEAAGAATEGHPVSAKDGYLRASTYYRTAEFFLHDNPDDPRIAYAYRRAVDCFRAAVPEAEPVEIPYEGTVLHGYFYRAEVAEGERRPVVVMHSGFDGAAEEMHFGGALAAVQRGYHVLSFDGPGQPSAIHLNKLTFRPDWEYVVGPVIDHLLATEPTVDPERIALLGVSLGGMLAPRAAAFEPRIAAVIALDGVYDAARPVVSAFGDRDELYRRAHAERDDELDELLEQASLANPTLRWAMGHGQFVMGASSKRAFVAAFLDYNLLDEVAEKIQCPTLVCAADDDLFFAGDSVASEPDLLFSHLTCSRKTLLRFTAEEGADAHCQVGAQRLACARIYDWLDAQFAG